ncbi:MAG: TonB-dependent receptor [Pseudomonadota bacterium]|nr:TonB-dependent receptor [Pseudomonadota bacterium]
MPGTRLGVILRARRSVSGFDQSGYDDPNATAHDTSLYGRAGITSALFGGAWETSLQVGALRHDRRYTDLLSADAPNASSGVSRYGGRRESLDWQNTIHLGDHGFARQVDVTAGYQHIADQAHLGVDTNSGGFAFQQSLAAHADSDAGYAGLQTLLFRRLTLSAQAREEATSLAGNAFTWRAGGVFAVPEIGVRLKASYGTAFRAPSLYDRYGVDSTGYAGNPNLRPERSTGLEAGAELDIPAGTRADFATLGATYFENHFRDLIQFQFAPVETEVNVDRASASGVELTLTLRPAPWATLTAAYTYTDTRDDLTGARLLRRPLNAASLRGTVKPWPKLEIAPELLYTGAFTDYLVDDTGQGAGPGRARSGLIANLSATYQLAPKLALFVWGRNLGGSRFEPANGYQTPGTSFLAGVRAGF